MAPRRPAKRLLTTLVLAGLAFAAGAQDNVRLPDLGSSANALISPQDAQDYGAAMLRQMRALDMVVDDPLLDDYINDLGFRLVATGAKPRDHFAFFIVKDDQINAFAAPGGYIAVNSGLITITRNESELAGVIAHEIGHITQNHLQRAFEASKKDAPLMALVLLGAIAAGTAPSFLQDHPVTTDRIADAKARAGALIAAQKLRPSGDTLLKGQWEQITAPIRTLDLVGYRVRERNFNNVIWKACCFGCPISECRSEAMDSDFALIHAPQQHEKGHVAKVAPGFQTRKYELVEFYRFELFQDFNRARAQRNAMLLACLHAFGWHNPELLFPVDLCPSHPDRLAGPRGGQDREFERPRRDTLQRAQPCHEDWQVGKW